MTQLKKRLICCISLILINACSDQAHKPAVIPNPAQQTQWQDVSAELFLNPSPEPDILTASERFNSMLLPEQASQQAIKQTLKQGVFDYSAFISAFKDKQIFTVHEAAKDRMLQRIKLLLAHQYISFDAVQLPPLLNTLIYEYSELTEYLENVKALVNEYPVLYTGSFEIYETSNEQGLLAYSRRIDNTRAFIAYNLSFDIHEMPLPFGFMASTKVTVWESGDMQVRSFVTSSPILIRPFSVVVVLVGL
jgi:hypothetical protein